MPSKSHVYYKAEWTAAVLTVDVADHLRASSDGHNAAAKVIADGNGRKKK